MIQTKLRKVGLGDYYVPYLYSPSIFEFRLSRSKLDLFRSCRRCFYLDRRCDVSRPGSYTLTLYNAVDTLIKKDFDIYRLLQKPHPIMRKNGLYAIPYADPNLDEWRDSYKGLTYKVPGTNIVLMGVLDDIWLDLKSGKLIVVDYKTTSYDGPINLSAPWQDANKRQMEVYLWLLKKNGYEASNMTYLLYSNGRKDVDFFNNHLFFDNVLVPHKVKDECEWVEHAVVEAYNCLQSDQLPEPNKACNYCSYVSKATIGQLNKI